jgi:hypothetical protein
MSNVRLHAMRIAHVASRCIEGKPPVSVLPLNHYPVRVVSIDGSIQFKMPVQVAPGPHMLVLEAFPSNSAKAVVQRAYAFKVEPCTRYYFLAARESPMASAWELVVHSTERVSSCKPAEEAKKSSSLSTHRVAAAAL